jgi:hypothetical protein
MGIKQKEKIHDEPPAIAKKLNQLSSFGQYHSNVFISEISIRPYIKGLGRTDERRSIELVPRDSACLGM